MGISTGAKIWIVVSCLLLIPVTLVASSLRISWNANTETDLDGYRIYYGHLSGSYEYVLDVGNCVCINIDGFEEDTVYFLAVTAYDLAGNESDYSSEVSVLIPGEQTSLLGVVVNWFFSMVTEVVSGGSDAPDYYLDDFSMVDNSVLVNSASLVMIGDSSVDPEDGAQDQDMYVISDILLEVGAVLDLSELYPVGSYLFVALTEDTPQIIDACIYGYESGSLLYMVTDSTGKFIDVLRISIVDELCYAGQFLPGSDLAFEILGDGISLVIPADAVNESLPVGIGCEETVQSGSAVQSFGESTVLMFDVVPYGLVLSNPAQICAAYDSGDPVVVEMYDHALKKWVSIDDVEAEDGTVCFTTMALGSFRVSSAAGGMDSSPSEAFTYESSAGRGCFIEVAGIVPSRGHRFILSLLLAVLALGSCFRYALPR